VFHQSKGESSTTTFFTLLRDQLKVQLNYSTVSKYYLICWGVVVFAYKPISEPQFYKASLTPPIINEVLHTYK
jgi:hypothetical protein